jgi:hypothetical protein
MRATYSHSIHIAHKKNFQLRFKNYFHEFSPMLPKASVFDVILLRSTFLQSFFLPSFLLSFHPSFLPSFFLPSFLLFSLFFSSFLISFFPYFCCCCCCARDLILHIMHVWQMLCHWATSHILMNFYIWKQLYCPLWMVSFHIKISISLISFIR